MYQGGKYRAGPKLADAIRPYADTHSTLIVPFIGMAGVSRNLPEFKDILVSDLNPNVVAFWRQTRDPLWKPKHYGNTKSREGFKQLVAARLRSSESMANRFLYLLTSSFNANMRNFTQTTHTDRTIDGLVEKANRVKNFTVVEAGSYDRFLGERGKVFYMDPPYYGVYGYKYVDKFDHELFWQHMYRLAENNVVFVSHYMLPDFVDKSRVRLVMQVDCHSGSGNKGMQKRVEHLYRVL